MPILVDSLLGNPTISDLKETINEHYNGIGEKVIGALQIAYLGLTPSEFEVKKKALPMEQGTVLYVEISSQKFGIKASIGILRWLNSGKGSRGVYFYDTSRDLAFDFKISDN